MTAADPAPGVEMGDLAELPGLEMVAGQLVPLMTVLRAEQARRRAGWLHKGTPAGHTEITEAVAS